MVVRIGDVCLRRLEGDDEADGEKEAPSVWDRPVELGLSRPSVQEEACRCQDATYDHGWDAPFWETVRGIVAALIVCVQLDSVSIDWF